MKKLADLFLAKAKKHAPLLIALGTALVFSTAHMIIEGGMFEHGPLSQKGLIHLLDLKSLDIKFASRKTDDLPPPKVVIAAIDEKGVERYGLWPWSRHVIAEFIEKTTAGGAKVIGFDAVFSDEDKNSSYRSIKRFLESYEKAELGSEKRLKLLVDQVRDAEAAVGEAKKRGDKPNPQAQKKLAQARAQLVEWQKRSGEFYEMMKKEVSSVSPDEHLARAIAGSPQTVLGYINFYNEADIVGLSREEAVDSIQRLEPVAIRQVFETSIQEVGGQELEIVQPAAGVKIDELQIRRSVGARVALPAFAQAAKGFGYFNVEPDPDGPMRKVRLLNKHKDALYPALSLLTAARYFGADIKPINGLIKPDITLEGIASLNPDTSDLVPTNMQGHFYINYYNDPTKYFKAYSVADFIDGTVPPEEYKDKVVLFGMTALGLFDLRPTPFGANTPGVYVHAATIQNMLDGKYVTRWFGLVLVEAFAYLVLGLIMGLVLPRIPAWAGLLATLLFAVGLYFVDSQLVFPKGVWMLNVLPTLQALVTFTGISLHGYLTEGKEKRQIRKAFQFYLTKSVVDQVLADPSKLKLGGVKKNCTILFSDVRGFTTISERLSPEGLVSLLNQYLTPMTDIVYKYEGTLDKYIGDAIMAIFGAPVDMDDHATRACHVCLEMMDSLKILQAGWKAQNLPDIDIGIGLNSGWVSAGNMGSSQRFDYTVMGDNVNLASRLESINKQYGTNIIISQSTYEAAKKDIHVREVDMVRVKGKREPVKIYELLGKGEPVGQAKDLIVEFDRAVQLYRSQKWDEAVALFDMIRANIKEADYCSEMYIERCKEMREHPPGADWDGVYTMTTK